MPLDSLVNTNNTMPMCGLALAWMWRPRGTLLLGVSLALSCSSGSGSDRPDADPTVASASVPTGAPSSPDVMQTIMPPVAPEPNAVGGAAGTPSSVAGGGVSGIGQTGGSGGVLAEGGAPPEVPLPAPSAELRFEPSGGGFAGGVDVQLQAADERVVVRYTLDGSLPSLNSTVYTAPITLANTAVIRAVTVFDDAVLGTFAQTYVALEAEAVDFSSNLPIVVLDRQGDTPIEVESDVLRTSSALTFEPDDTGRSRLNGAATSVNRAGVRVRGSSSRRFPQKSFAVELWEPGVDDDLHVPWLGMPEESDFTLIAPSRMDRSLMRTMLPMDLSRAIGSYAPRTRFVEVFLVDRQGAQSLSLDDYVGVYTAAEKVKRDSNRVDVAKLEATDVTDPEVTGGYIFRIDHTSRDFVAGGYEFEWDYPDALEMQSEERARQREYLTGYLDEFFDALRMGGDYASYIDVPKWIDHNLLIALTKNVDGLRLSAYFHKDRNGPVVAGPIWDFDRSQGTPHDQRATRPDEWGSGDGTLPLSELFWAELFEQPDFEAAYWERWAALAQTEFSVDSIIARIDAYETELLEARQRHFARFEELPPEGGPEGEVELLREFYRQRVPWLSAQRP